MRFLLIFPFLFILGICQSQDIKGLILNDAQAPMIGAVVSWKNSQRSTISDENGHFSIAADSLPQILQITYVGFDPMEVEVLPGENNLEIEITGIVQLKEIEIEGQKTSTYVSTINPLNVEHIDKSEFQKAACCSLAESFETNGSADVTMTDALSGAKEIQMLGLRGLYTQLLQENRPAMGGLATPFALDFIPGTWLESIQISKGASSVLMGSTALSGMINYELVKPNTDKPIFINLFGNTNGRFESNVHLNKALNDQWSMGVLLHYSTFQNQIDRDGDSFMDAPLKEQFNGMYRLQYRSKKWFSQFSFQALKDKHQGGQLTSANENPALRFNTNRSFARTELSGKLGYTGFEHNTQSIGLTYSYTNNLVDAKYGANVHSGDENTVFVNLIYMNVIAQNLDHKYTVGASYLWDDFDERYGSYVLDRTERLSSLYGEYNYCHDESKNSFLDKVGFMAGMRLEYHPKYGWMPAPRVNAKYQFTEDAILRVSAGRGFRIPNVISDNIGGLISNKPLQLANDIDIERAWNYGLNYTQTFYIGLKRFQFNTDVYRTDFQSQMVLDMDSDPKVLKIYNLEGKSYSNSFLVGLQIPVFRLLDIKLVYKFNDVRMTFQGEILQKPMNAKHRGLVNLDFHSPDKRWKWNTHVQIVGKQRFPSHAGIPEQYITYKGDYSPAYVIVNTQLAWTIKNMEWY
ncbi:MAG: TonB-dependent receptor, partial [Saprospiraceae bacterium]